MQRNYRFDASPGMDLFPKDLGYFLAIAETLNISKAAELLGIQQSGLSRSLARLEAEVGRKLCLRRNNGLLLTEAGERFLLAVKNTRQSWEEGFKQVLGDSDQPSGLIRIGFHPSLGQKTFPKIVNALSEEFPAVEIEAFTLTSLQVARKVNAQELDFGIVINKMKFSELVQRKLFQDYIAAYQRTPSTLPTRVLLNPDMQSLPAVQRKFSSVKKVLIPDYEIMAKVALNGPHLAVLPYSVAEGFPKLRQVSGAYLKTDVSLITHGDKLRIKPNRLVFEAIARACSSH